jgi:hypothetical protein
VRLRNCAALALSLCLCHIKSSSMAEQDQIYKAFSRLQDLLAFAEHPPSLSIQQRDVVSSAFLIFTESESTAINHAALYALNHLIYCDGVADADRVFGQLFRLWTRLSSPNSSDDLNCVQALGSACVSMLASFLSTKVPVSTGTSDAALPLSCSLHNALLASTNPAAIVTLLDWCAARRRAMLLHAAH